MLALSLLQPWAQLIADGRKKIETRSWQANPGILKVGDLYVIAASAKMNPVDRDCAEAFGYTAPRFLTLGAAICVVRHKGCFPTERILSDSRFTDEEWSYGDYSPGRYGWMLELVHVIDRPIPVKGRLGLWDVPADVEREIRLQMGVTA